MIISPLVAIREGMITFPEHVIDQEKHIQQNGIDITLDALFMLDSIPGLLTEQNRGFKPTFAVNPIDCYYKDVPYPNSFCIKQGLVYDWHSDFKINVPTDICALVMIRSSFNRLGGKVDTGNWDSGFNGNLGGTLQSRSGDIIVQQHTRIAQVMFFRAEAASLYNGIYNNIDGHWKKNG